MEERSYAVEVEVCSAVEECNSYDHLSKVTGYQRNMTYLEEGWLLPQTG